MKRVLATAVAVGAVFAAVACSGGGEPYTFDNFQADVKAAGGKASSDATMGKLMLDGACKENAGKSIKDLARVGEGSKMDLAKYDAAVDKYCAANR